MLLSALATLLQLGLNYVSSIKEKRHFQKGMRRKGAPTKASVKITLTGYLTDILFVHAIRVFVLGLETGCHII
jgi:hypothetical protein